MRGRFHIQLLVALAACLPRVVTAQSVPAPWTATDIGAPAIQGSASFDGPTVSISGAGSGLSREADQFTFVYQSLTGDGAIVARVEGLTATSGPAEAGLMIRESLVPGAKDAAVLSSARHGVAFQRRSQSDTVPALTPGTAHAGPVWLRLERRGSMLTALRSLDGATWTNVGTDVISMLPTVYMGMVVTNSSVDPGAPATFSSVSVSPLDPVPDSIPPGWTSTDVGLPSQPGSAAYGAGLFAVTGGGTDIWGTADQFHYLYLQVTGDVEISGRVIAVEAVDSWSKGGIMLRDDLTPNAAHVSLLVTPARGVAFERRPVPGGRSLYSRVSRGRPPRWLKLQRRGARVTAYQSFDGRTWIRTGTAVLALPTIYVGLAVTSRDSATTATTLFDHIVVGRPNHPPAVVLTAPDDQARFVEPATVEVSAAAIDVDGSVARVDFFAGSTPIGSASTPPYAVTWDDVPPGSYPLRAVAWDNDRAIGVSAPKLILVDPLTGTYHAVFVPSSNHDQAVTTYVLDVYPSDAPPPTGTAIANAALGKPIVLGGTCNVDVTAAITSLPPGAFIVTVTAIGPGGVARSEPSAPFVR